MKTLLVAAFLVAAACGGSSRPASSPTPERSVRLLEADDVALRPVMYAAAKHLFDPNASQLLGFNGVYVNKKLEPSLSADVQNYLVRIGGLREASTPASCEPAMEPPARQRPAASGPTGGAPNPTSQPKRPTNAALCNRHADVYYSFTSTRIASDTAYVEVQMAGVAKSTTKCLALTVDRDAGGWKAGEMKTTKISRCGA